MTLDVATRRTRTAGLLDVAGTPALRLITRHLTDLQR